MTKELSVGSRVEIFAANVNEDVIRKLGGVIVKRDDNSYTVNCDGIEFLVQEKGYKPKSGLKKVVKRSDVDFLIEIIKDNPYTVFPFFVCRETLSLAVKEIFGESEVDLLENENGLVISTINNNFVFLTLDNGCVKVFKSHDFVTYLNPDGALVKTIAYFLSKGCKIIYKNSAASVVKTLSFKRIKEEK